MSAQLTLERRRPFVPLGERLRKLIDQALRQRFVVRPERRSMKSMIAAK